MEGKAAQGSSERAWAASEFQLRTGPLVNLTSMAHIVRIDAAELEVEFVNDAVIANS
jgi:hypothetical protein